MGKKIPLPGFFTVDKLERALQQNPDDVGANLILGEKLIEQREYARALGPLKTAYSAMSKALNERTMGQKTIQIATTFLPTSYSIEHFKSVLCLTLESIAISHMELREFHEAKGYQRQNLEMYDNDPDSWNLFGVILSRVGDINDAESAYLSALLQDPLHEKAWINLAREFQIHGIPDEADRIQVFLRSTRKRWEAITLLLELLLACRAYTFSKHDKYEVVIEAAQRFLKETVLNNGILDTLCRVFIFQGNYEAARRILEKRFTKYPENATYRWQLARVYALENNAAECLNLLSGFKEGSPHYDQSILLRDALNSDGDSTQTLRAFFQYYITRETPEPHGSHRETSVFFRYLTEIQVNLGTTVGDFIHFLVNAEVEKLTPYEGIPSVMSSWPIGPGGGGYYCHASPCMLNEIEGDNPKSFSITYDVTGINRSKSTAEYSDLLISGDVLLLLKRPSKRTHVGAMMTTALILGPEMKRMIDEEKKGMQKIRNFREKSFRKADAISPERIAFVDEILKAMDKHRL